jgi:hypothetical protein
LSIIKRNIWLGLLAIRHAWFNHAQESAAGIISMLDAVKLLPDLPGDR